MEQSNFLPQKNNYRNLIAYQKAECIYDITYFFAHKFLDAKDRTIDQMIQAARSGKQNIAEGECASTTSTETELKLLNVARASLQELLADYEDFLRVRGLCQWSSDSEKHQQARKVCKEHSNSDFYRQAIQTRSAETIANIAIILIYQTDTLLNGLFERRKDDFLRNGGVREQLTKARLQTRNTK